MGSCANVMALLAFGILLGVVVGAVDGMPCFYPDRDWIDKGLDFVYNNKGSLTSAEGNASRCYSDEERIGFVVVVVVVVILILEMLSCIASCCFSSSRRSSRTVVVGGLDSKMNTV